MPEDDKNKKTGPDTEKNEPLENRGRIEGVLGESHPLLPREKIQSILAFDFMPSLVQLTASLPEAPEVDPGLLTERMQALALTPEQTNHLKTRLDLSKMLCGQTGRDLRRELDAFAQSQGEAMAGMIAPELLKAEQEIQTFLKKLADGSALADDLPSEPLSEELTLMIGKPEALYERILTEANRVNFRAGDHGCLPEIWRKRPAYLELSDDSFEYDPLRMIAGRMYNFMKDEEISNKKVKKWIDLVGLTFLDPRQIETGLLLDTLGYIPEELYTKKMFREKVTFEHLVKMHAQIREIAEGRYFHDTTAMGDHNKRRLLHARAQLIRHLFTSGIAETVKRPDEDQITLDANGLFINLSAGRQHKKAAHVGLHSHLPYSQVTDELLDYLLERQWITQRDYEEIRLQRAKVNNDVTTESAIEDQKAARYYKAALAEYESSPGGNHFEDLIQEHTEKIMKRKDCPSESFAKLVAFMRWHMTKPFALWNPFLKDPELHVPEAAFRYFLLVYKDEIPNLSAGTILQIASEIQKGIGKPISENRYKEEANLDSDYERRRQILNDKRHYNAAKAIGVLMEQGLPPNDPQNTFAVCRSRFETKRGDEHHFLKMIVGELENEILLIPRKQLNARQRQAFSEVPELSRSGYAEWSRQIREYQKARANFEETIKSVSMSDVEATKGRFLPAAKGFIDFMRREIPNDLMTAEELVGQAEKETDIDKLRTIIQRYNRLVCVKILKSFQTRLYTFESTRNNLDK